jgi:DNA-binding response OmpR family regulator
MSRSTILIVEGEAQVLRLLSWLLDEEGYEVASVSNPLDATNHVVANRPDVVIFNTGLPDARKKEWIDEWRETAPETRVLDLRNPGTPPRMPSQIGADGVLVTPFHIDSLLDVLKSFFA